MKISNWCWNVVYIFKYISHMSTLLRLLAFLLSLIILGMLIFNTHFLCLNSTQWAFLVMSSSSDKGMGNYNITAFSREDFFEYQCNFSRSIHVIYQSCSSLQNNLDLYFKSFSQTIQIYSQESIKKDAFLLCFLSFLW